MSDVSHAVRSASGRPRRSPRPSTDPGDPQRRIAWLLRTNRLYGPAEAWVRAGAFVRDFPGGSWTSHASEFQVSRWETAAGRAPYQAIRRYEELLGLRRGALVAAADNAYRSVSGTAGIRLLERGIDVDGPDAHLVTDQLLERALTNDVMTGDDWDGLTSHLVAFRDAYVPGSVWSAIAERLLSEQLIARGVAWFQRYESFNRLLAHPRAQAAAIAACAAAAADRGNQVRVEPISVLDATDHPDAARLVLGELGSPTSLDATLGALIASVRKLQLGHFQPEQRPRLQRALLDLVHDASLRTPVHALAVELLRQLPASPSGGAAALRRIVASDMTLNQVLTDGRFAARDAGLVVVDRVVNRAIAVLPRDVSGYHDDVLSEVVDDALHSPNLDIRLAAAQQLTASPYRAPVAAAISEELRSRDVLTDPDRAAAMLDLLGYAGRPEDRLLVERLVVAGGPPTLVYAASRRSAVSPATAPTSSGGTRSTNTVGPGAGRAGRCTRPCSAGSCTPSGWYAGKRCYGTPWATRNFPRRPVRRPRGG